MDFDFKEIDEEGQETLEAITAADKFNNWMYSTISPYCSGKILEVGSGIGNISSFFINNKANLTLSDVRNNYVQTLQQKFPSQNTFLLDLVLPEFENEYQEYLGTFDTVFALNVIEHIEDHKLAMENIHKLLKPGGRAVILVPAFQSLYNRIDKELYHYRRYTRKTLLKIFGPSQFKITKSRYFNFTGIFAWFIGGKIFKDSTVKKGKMKLYNSLVPIFKVIDIPLKQIAGLSVIVVGEKK
jgi:2-polyprenyl-3-methyl-5-hydroxy-6-metoxy-1,4-benzoquinol methylase